MANAAVSTIIAAIKNLLSIGFSFYVFIIWGQRYCFSVNYARKSSFFLQYQNDDIWVHVANEAESMVAAMI
jgi:hypothetical protein